MSKIIGVTVGSSLPKPNFKQTDPTKGDYIKNKPDFDGLKSKVEQIEVRVDTMQENAYDDTELRGIVSENVAKIDTLNELVGNTKVETQISDAVDTLESEIDGKFGTMQSDLDSKVDAEDGKGLSTNDYTDEEQQKLRDIEPNANFYEHPEHTSHSSGLYKVTVDGEGHVSGATLAEKDDIIALGIPAQDTTYDTEISDLNKVISDAESGIRTNKTAIEEIQDDYLKSTDKTQLQDDIKIVFEKATANAAAIEKLNGDEYTEGSVKQSINTAFNEFAANLTNNDVIDTYKELIDYAAKHAPEFDDLVAEVGGIDSRVGGIDSRVGTIEADLPGYKETVTSRFDGIDQEIEGYINDTQEALEGKADLEHEHNDLYYTKDEILESITVDDIDDICGSNQIVDGDVGVVSYASKQWVQEGFQPKGEYLTDIPAGYATEEFVTAKITEAELGNGSGCSGDCFVAQPEAPSDTSVLWLDTDDDSVGSGGNVELDTTLTDEGKAADAKAVGDALKNKLASSELSNAINTALTQAKESGDFDGKDSADGKDYVLTDADKSEIAETIKADVPLVKVAEQPTFVNSEDEMTDTSKVYVLLTDGCFYTNREVEQSAYTFTADDFVATGVESNGALSSGSSTRIATKSLLKLSDGVISVNCPAPYEYFVYYYTDEKESGYIGKTSWKSGNIDDVSKDVIGSGTSGGAKYCRISLRDKNSTTSLIGRIDEFLSHITIAQDRSSAEPVYKWVNTGLFYNQPADYEDRIIALEKAWEGIENGNDRVY